MAPQQILACGVAACTFATVVSLTEVGQDFAGGVRCVLTEETRLHELQAVGDDAVAQLAGPVAGSVRGPERIAHCTQVPDVAVAYYLHGDPRHPGRWRTAVDRTLEEHAARVDRDDEYEVTAGYPVRSGDGYVLPVTVWFSGHPRFQPAD